MILDVIAYIIILMVSIGVGMGLLYVIAEAYKGNPEMMWVLGVVISITAAFSWAIGWIFG